MYYVKLLLPIIVLFSFSFLFLFNFGSTYMKFMSLNSCEYMTFYERDRVELGPLNVDYHVYLEQYHEQNHARIHSIMKCRNYQTMPVIYTVIMARVKFNKKLSDFRYARISTRADMLTSLNTPRFLHQKNKTADPLNDGTEIPTFVIDNDNLDCRLTWQNGYKDYEALLQLPDFNSSYSRENIFSYIFKNEESDLLQCKYIHSNSDSFIVMWSLIDLLILLAEIAAVYFVALFLYRKLENNHHHHHHHHHHQPNIKHEKQDNNV